MDDTDNVDGTLDPRIQIELENLNDATDDINKLETELDEAHTAFRQLLSETTKRLKEILNKVGNSSVEKARCYYEALEIAHQAQIRCQQQAQLFQRASEIHAAAKETVALAESRFMSHQHEWNFDQAWQDMLNHATLKVMDAENQKAECGREHYRRAVLFHEAEKRLLQLEEKHRRAILKARPYFEVKAQCDQMLATQKERVECLQKAIQDAKNNYAASLRRLEEISNQIHQHRQDYDIITNGPREPGVGAELVSPQKCTDYDTEFAHVDVNEIKDATNNGLDTYNRIEKYDSSCQLQEDPEHLGKRSVDGSEATASQWELELEATMENLNKLTQLSRINHDSKNENISDLHYYDNEKAEANNLSREFSCNFLKDNDYSAQNLSESKQQLSKNSFTNSPMRTYFEESAVIKNDIADSLLLSKHKVNLNNNTSKSLRNSPAKANLLNFCSKIGHKEIRETIAKYVPSNVLNFGFNSTKSQSSGDINLSLKLGMTCVEKYPSSDNILENKTDNNEFDKQNTGLRNNNRSLSTKEMYDSNLKLRCAQLNTTRTNCKINTEIAPERKWFRSNSTQFLSSNANVSSVKQTADSPCVNSLRKLSGDSNQSFTFQKLVENASSVKAFPLLTLFNKSNSLTDNRGKFVSLDNLHTNSVQTSSTSESEKQKDDTSLKIRK